MAVKIKICGLTNLEDARIAIAAGADLLGFIFYAKSPRYIAPEQAQTIITTLKHSLANENQPTNQLTNPSTNQPHFVGVFVNETPERINTIVELAGLDFVQLHGNETADHFARLHGRAFKALRPATSEEALAGAITFAGLGPAHGPRLLIDAFDPKAYGGTGKQTDWHTAAHLARQYPGLLLAGGLTPDNVADAICTVRPWGVDVSSGVEAEPGRKDHAKVWQFVENARAIRL